MAKYTKLKKTINRMIKLGFLKKELKEELLRITIHEYEDCLDNPNDAKISDLVEIADASSL